MASCWSNFFAILLIATVTFVVLDVNKHETFNRTATAKYLKLIGAKPYVDKAIVAIGTSKVYKQHINPYWLAFVSQFRQSTNLVLSHTSKYTSRVTVYLKKHSTAFLDYIDTVVAPIVKKNSIQYYNIIAKHATKSYNSIKKSLLIFVEWFNANVFSVSKFDSETVSKVLLDLITNTQKAALNSYQWFSGQVGKLVA